MTTRVRLTDDWLPLPATLLRTLGWMEGDQIDLEVAADGIVLATRVGAAERPVQPADPPRKKAL